MHGFFGMLIWLLVIIGALNWGLDAFHYNLFKMPFFARMPQVVMALKVIVGLAGVVSLVHFVSKVF